MSIGMRWINIFLVKSVREIEKECNLMAPVPLPHNVALTLKQVHLGSIQRFSTFVHSSFFKEHILIYRKGQPEIIIRR